MRRSVPLWPVVVMLVAVLSLGGCQALRPGEAEEPGVEAPPLPPSPGMYLDFEDVQVPSGLTLNRQASFVYQSETLRTGVLTFTGPQPLEEVLSFFKENMPRDNWRLLSSFKYQKNILIYLKTGKMCLIVLEQPPGLGALKVEVWVAPVKSEASPAAEVLPLLKPWESKEEPLPESPPPPRPESGGETRPEGE